MIRNLGNIFKVEDLRRRILYTLMMLVIFRIGSFIPVPNTNAEALQMLMDQAQGVLVSSMRFPGGLSRTSPFLRWGLCPISLLRSLCNF